MRIFGGRAEVAALLNTELITAVDEDGRMRVIDMDGERLLPVFTTPESLPERLPHGCVRWQSTTGHQLAEAAGPDEQLAILVQPGAVIVPVYALWHLSVAMRETAVAYCGGDTGEGAVREEFDRAVVYCQAAREPGFVAFGEEPPRLVPVFSSLTLYASFHSRNAAPEEEPAWFSSTGREILSLLPEEHVLQLDPGSPHSITIERTAIKPSR